MRVTKLSQATLSSLGPSVAVPGYDRSAVKPGLVHFGVGNFHRVHLAVYVDRCLAKGETDWGICGVELMDFPGAKAKADAYAAQDCLYTVTESAPDGTDEIRVIGAMVAYLHAPADPEAVLKRLAHPDTKIVSLTITEGGYNLDEATGAFALNTPDVASDLKGGAPKTAFGFITEGLARRRAAGLPAYTVMSCDNLRHNGDTARKAIVSFARARDAALGDWIDKNAAFPNSMVDRIAPQVPEAVRQRLNAKSGVEDALPALGEDFMQFVLEDAFSHGRPDLGSVGVELRDDVGVFEVMKQRVLNASHMMLGYPGLLTGYRIVHEAMQDKRFFALLDSFQDNDVLPLCGGAARCGPQGLQGQGAGALRQPRGQRPAPAPVARRLGEVPRLPFPRSCRPCSNRAGTRGVRRSSSPASSATCPARTTRARPSPSTSRTSARRIGR